MVTQQTGTQAVDRAAELLAHVVEAAAPRTFTSLVEETGLAKSTASRLLQALERHRLVQRDRSGGFRPGAVFALYAARQSFGSDFVELTTPTLERIGARTGETVNLAVPRGDAVVQVAQVDSVHLLGTTKKDQWPASPEVTEADIRAWEKKHGELKPGDIVIFHSGWSDKHYRPLPAGATCM